MDIGGLHLSHLVATISSHQGRKCDDIVARLSNKYSVRMLMIFASVMTIQLLVGKHIVCWAPAHFTLAHIHYTNSYCWVQNTYYLPWMDENVGSRRDTQYVVYYQWMPFILTLQALMFYCPKLLWKTIINWDDIELPDIIEFALAVKRAMGLRGRERALKLTTRHIIDGMRQKNPKSRCTLKFGNTLAISYIFTKILYIINPLVQLILLHNVFKADMLTYGFKAVVAPNDDYSSESALFPRVTRCELVVRRLGNNHKYNLQCVLPNNYFVEKIVTFLWFWLWLVFLVSICSLFCWIYWLITSVRQQKLVRKYLWDSGRIHVQRQIKTPSSKKKEPAGDYHKGENNNINLVHGKKDSDVNEREPEAKAKRKPNLWTLFQNKFLHWDGIFLFQLIEMNTDRIVTLEIIGRVYDDWKSDYNKKLINEEKQNEINASKSKLKSVVTRCCVLRIIEEGTEATLEK